MRPFQCLTSRHPIYTPHTNLRERLYCLDSGGAHTLWWDGYRAEEVLLIDDYDGWIGWSTFLRVLDRYPLRINVKGGHGWARYTKVIITSNVPYVDWYPMQQDQAPLARRIGFSMCTTGTPYNLIVDGLAGYLDAPIADDVRDIPRARSPSPDIVILDD